MLSVAIHREQLVQNRSAWRTDAQLPPKLFQWFSVRATVLRNKTIKLCCSSACGFWRILVERLRQHKSFINVSAWSSSWGYLDLQGIHTTKVFWCHAWESGLQHLHQREIEELILCIKVLRGVRDCHRSKRYSTSFPGLFSPGNEVERYCVSLLCP